MSSLNFGFSKKKDLSKLKSSVINEQEKESEDEEEIINVLEDSEIKGTRLVEKKTDLVIKMISKNKWRGAVTPAELEKRDDPKGNGEQEEKKEINVDLSSVKTEDRAALMELLGKASNGSALLQDPSFSIPLILKNKVPEGFETDTKLDVSIRPEEPEQADYDDVPIDQFGMAMLRGMGWKKGSFGKHKCVDPITAVARPKGLGLGADRSLLSTNGGTTDTKGKDGEQDAALAFKKGAYCLVSNGKHKNAYGIVEGLDTDNAQIILKLTLSRKVASVSQYACTLVTEKEFNKYSKYLNKVDVDNYKKEEEVTNEAKRRKKEDDYNNRHETKEDRKHSRRHRDEETDERKHSRHHRKDEEDGKHSRHHREDEDDRKHSRRHRGEETDERKHSRHHREDEEDSKHSKHHKEDEEDRISSRKRHIHQDSDDHKEYKSSKKESNHKLRKMWLQNNLRVRIIDNKYKKGKYFKEKVIIEDVVEQYVCICRTDTGKVLDELSQNQLETVVPRDVHSYVKIVKGSHSGELAEMLVKDKKAYKATLQLLSDRDQLLELSFDDICEYTGNIDSQIDY